MPILLFLLFLICSMNAWGSTVTVPTTWSDGDSVTATKLNGINSTFANVINGGLDNTNADTTNGYFLYKKVSALPSAGTQGAVYFLTSDNTLNFDTGSTFIKTVAVSGSASQGDVIYYTGSAWARLSAGTSGTYLKTQGAGANPTWSAVSNATGLSITSQANGDILYYNGSSWVRLAVGTAGQVLQTGTPPSWGNALSQVLDYGTSTSSSTSRQATTIKMAYGQGVSISSGSTSSITNLPFSSSSTYTCTVSENDSSASDEARGSIGVTYSSGGTAVIYNTDNATRTAAWICVGT